MNKPSGRNTEIMGNTRNRLFIIGFAFLIPGCNSATLESGLHRYQERGAQIMHVTRDQAFGDEHNTYSTLYSYWRKENAEIRQKAYYQKSLSNLETHKPKQLLYPGGSNSPVGISEWGVPSSEASLPTASL